MNFDSFVLAASTADLGDAETGVARERADAVEFRMDLAAKPLAALDDYDGPLPVIATNRAAWEGGEAADAGRLEVLEQAVKHPCVEAIDVELRSVDRGDADATVDHARREGASVVVSVHDFEGTPDGERLAELLAAAASAGDVGKLAVTADDPADVLRLLSVTHAITDEGERVATMAMGEAGRHSRAIAPLYGSRIGYAPVTPADATAPGQYDLATLADLIARLRGA